jgi:L-alanine-DL-glutamate epimerase-like enolase superfamily enzyme
VGITLTNLDDGNQYMNHLLVHDIIKHPDLSLQKGSVPLLTGPGLGFELDFEAVARAAENHSRAAHRR